MYVLGLSSSGALVTTTSETTAEQAPGPTPLGVAAASPLTRGAAWGVAVVATLAMSVSYLDRQALAALAPTVTKELCINETQYGWLTGAFSMAYLVGSPVAGVLLDRLGARRGLAAAVLVWSLVAAAHSLAASFAFLFGLRVLLGLTESPSFPGASQSVRRALPPKERSLGFGLLFTGSSLGAMIAGPLAVWMKVHCGWRFGFVGTAVAGLLWVPLWLIVTGSEAARRTLEAGAESTATAPAAATSATTSRGWVGLLREPAVVRALVLVVASAPAVMFVLNWAAKLLVFQKWATQDEIGHYTVFPPIFFDAGAVGFGAIASRIDQRRPANDTRSHGVLVALAALLTACIALTPLASGPWQATVLGGVSLLGGAGLFALLTADMMSRLPPSRASSAGGLTAAAQSIAYVIANPLVGKSVDVTRSYTWALVAIGLLVLPGAAAWIVWPVRTPRQG
jgi:ACS family hexuronate transporter-like MFS transporter